MATKEIPVDTVQLPVEQHRVSCGTRPAIYAGTLASKGWRTGKEVTRAEYEAAVRDFLNGGGAHAAGR